MSSDIAIRVENLGKMYRIGGPQTRYNTFRETLTDAFTAPFRRAGRLLRGQGSAADLDQTIWALKDVNFEVKRGEVVGIIGRNGAGKSTLLKILSRITEPTEGKADIFGRVGSLLEVGTGFHPELTGRENIYLNGAILGMRRTEIDRKLDEIVAFAEIEKFLDTPVKHYSSGMYVRLAFAVAAHLEPEILLVDEVLAVGDSEFQKKCLGKLGEVSRSGRTILFVSHNLQAIQSLCSRVVLLGSGRILMDGNPRDAVNDYLASATAMTTQQDWPDGGIGDDEIRLTGLRVCRGDGIPRIDFSSSCSIVIELQFTAKSAPSSLCVGFDLLTQDGLVVARSYQTDMAPGDLPTLRVGENVWRCTIPPGLFNAGTYLISPRIGLHNMRWIVKSDPVARFEVLLDHGVSPFWSSLDRKSRPGVIAPIFSWEAGSRVCIGRHGLLQSEGSD